jgi:SEC-C motif
MILAAVADKGMELFVVSNFDNPSGPPLSGLSPTLEVHRVNLNTPCSLIYGVVESVSEPDRKFLKELAESVRPVVEIQEALAKINERAAARSADSVSAECMVSSLSADRTSSSRNFGSVPGIPDSFMGGINISEFIKKNFKSVPGKPIALVQSAGKSGTGVPVPEPAGPPRRLSFSTQNSSCEIKDDVGRKIGTLSLVGLDGTVDVVKNQWSGRVPINRLELNLTNPDGGLDGAHFQGQLPNVPTVDGASPRNWDYQFDLFFEKGEARILVAQMSVAFRSVNHSAPLPILGAQEELVMTAPPETVNQTLDVAKDKLTTVLAVRFLLRDFPELNQPLSEVEIRRLQGTKIGRNEMCPCGSGKKYKRRHAKS